MVALGVAVAVAMGVTLVRQPRQVGDAARGVEPAAPAVSPQAPPASAPPLTSGDAGAPGAGPPPAGVTAQQWAALQQEYAAQPDGAAQIARVVEFLQYRHELERFRALRADPQADREAVRAAARTLDAGLDTRLARGEVSAPEARLIKTATAEVLLPDAASRQTAVAAWQQALAARTAATPEPRLAEFRAREAELVAAWQALPPAQRDPDRLSRDLQALRQQMFDPPGAQTPASVPARGGS